MVKEITSKEIKEHVEKGYIRANILFEIVGNPEEHVSKTMDALIKHLEQQKDIIFINKEVGEPEETKDGLFGSYCEADLLLKNFGKLTWVIFNFMPASVEIIDPAKLTLKDKELTDLTNDVLAFLHETNTRVIQTNSLNQGMLRSINALVRNSILLTLLNGSKTAEEISKMAGITTKDLEPVFEAMIKEKTLIKKEDKYSRA